MEEIKLKDLDLTCFHEVLDNNLNIYLVPMKSRNRYTCFYGTHFGFNNISFKPSGSTEYETVPCGIAHFLEHKMFESESGEKPFDFFTKTGADFNAFTDYDRTVYYCAGDKHFSKNLGFLLDYVNEPYFTDENVNKEVGIISEEINMYKDDVDSVFWNGINESLFKVHPQKNDVAGEIEDIKKITKEDLYLCYNNFYIPSNMFVIVTGNFDKNEALKVIKSKFKTNGVNKLPELKKYNEKTEVNIKRKETKFNTKVPRVSISYKLNLKDYKMTDSMFDLKLSIILYNAFGPSSEFVEKLTKNPGITNFEYLINHVDNFRTVIFSCATDKKDEFINLVKKTIENTKLTKIDLERIKKVFISDSVRLSQNEEHLAFAMLNDIIKYKKIFENTTTIIRTMKLEDLNKLKKSLDLTNDCIYILENS